jgi:CheY-like chemotaxis protein
MLKEKSVLRRILIVDDEALCVATMQIGLKRLPDCELITAFSGEEALQYAKQQPLDLLITDYRMPGINGITLARQVRQLYPEAAIVIVTASSNDEVREQAADLPIHTILDKPVTLAKLRQVVSAALKNGQGE